MGHTPDVGVFAGVAGATTRCSIKRRVRKKAFKGCLSVRQRLEQGKLKHLEEENAYLRAEVDRLKHHCRERRFDAASCWDQLCVSSPLTDTEIWEQLRPYGTSNQYKWWQSWCPCCKRPLDVTIYPGHQAMEDETSRTIEVDDVQPPMSSLDSPQPVSATPTQPRYAYVTSVWGCDPGFVLGALVLGSSLRQRGSVHDLVLLHTDDLPASSLEILSRVWILRLVEYVQADDSLFTCKGTRFDGVFTKLHALSLTDYSKVMMLDIDLAILRCPDELFESRAPAALCRGVRNTHHGYPMDCRHFFGAELADQVNRKNAWRQSGGINAGVMILTPDEDLFKRTLREVHDPVHPEHIPGSGPEQDYLSRLFAPYWNHLGVKYNYQLHQVFIALELSLKVRLPLTSEAPSADSVDEDPWVPERLRLNADELFIVHYSGELKIWHRDHLNGESDDAFVERLLRDSRPCSCRLWIDAAGEPSEYEPYGLRVENGEFWSTVSGANLTSHIKLGVAQVRAAALKAVRQWGKDLEALPDAFDLPALPDLLCRLQKPVWPADALFARGAIVEHLYHGSHWYKARVDGIHLDGTYAVTYETPGYWGSGARNVKPEVLRAA